MFAKPFNRKAAIIAGFVVLIFNALINYCTTLSSLGHFAFFIYMSVDFAGWIPTFLVLMTLEHSVGALGHLLVDIITSGLSAAFWALIFGYVFKQKVAV